MIYNIEEANFQKKCKENFEELKKYISSPSNEHKLCDWIFAYEYIINMENTIKEQNKKLKEYNNFFNTLNNFLPSNKNIEKF